jgi:integrase
VRRILLHPEWDYLRDHIGRSNVRRRKIPAEDRQALYAAAILTGFRAVECSRLRIMDLHVDGPRKSLYLSGRGDQRTKNGKPARQYLNADVAERLQRMIERRFAGWAPRLRRVDGPLWKISRTTWSHIAEVLAEDVAAARADYEVRQAAQGQPVDPNFLQVVDANGEVLDFHALRYTCGAWLVHAGVDIKTVQSIMRHSSITLTMDTYGRMYPGNDWEAAMALSRWV